MQMVAPSQPLGASEACRPLARLRPEAPEAVFRQDPVLPAPDSPACPTHRPRYTFVGALTPLLCLKFVLEETWPRAARIGAPDPQRTAGWGWGWGVTSPAVLAPVPQCQLCGARPAPKVSFGIDVWGSAQPVDVGSQGIKVRVDRAGGLVCSVYPTSRGWAGSPQGCTPHPPCPLTEQRGLLVHRWELSRAVARAVIPGSPRKSPAPSSVSRLCTRPSLPPRPTSGQHSGSSEDQRGLTS